MSLKQHFRDLLRRKNLWLHGAGSLPKGVDMWHDLNRYQISKNFRQGVDVGANVGSFTLEALRHFPHLKMDCFEIEKQNFDVLQRVFSNDDRVTCHHCGAGSRNERMEFHVQKASTYHSLLPIVDDSTDETEVQMIDVRRLDSIISLKESQHLDLLKTDTEGYDMEVLLGSELFFKKEAVRCVLSEVGFNRGDRRHTPFSKVHEFLCDYGFDLFGIYDQGHWWQNNSIDYANALYVHRNVTEC